MKKYLLLLLVVTFVSGCRRNATTEFVESVSCYSDFSTVDWSALSGKYYRPNTADWDSAVDEQIIEGFPGEIAAEYNSRMDTWETARNVCIGAAATIYVVNLIDAFCTKGAKHVKVEKNQIIFHYAHLLILTVLALH